MLNGLSSDLLATIAGLLDVRSRRSLSHVSAHTLHASRLATWWPAGLRLRLLTPGALDSFTAWVEARTLGTERLAVRVASERLVDKKGHELQRAHAYDGGKAFERLMAALVAHMPRLQHLGMEVAAGTLFLPVG